jgi:hypothetical protein
MESSVNKTTVATYQDRKLGDIKYRNKNNETLKY